MPDESPRLIAINHDDYHAEHVGRTPEGYQFFLTTPFEPAISGNPGCEYVALFLFNKEGDLIEARIDRFGPRNTMDREARTQLYEKRLGDLGEVSFERIEIKPFMVEHFGVHFGLIVREPEDAEEVWAVELHPGNYMAFFELWDSGEYDT